ncbi:TPA: fimbrial protein [Salmonella enterica subsp. salamae serovar 16:m,t:e,n,x]|uniref:Fimbrial protein n=1 Tax=Salmonella enterica subsp. salamae TaxID=59202 RepID=A0A6C8YFW2_SALER|nr:fimbrial protein [Salmonella enterica]EAB6844147.1 fimbrial protein [Salmonella enterica subsp. salamae]ECF6027641.1 fimbrial protein [Salmonella enterica subsp. salamae serovar Greenside]EDT2641263.1 fimbrial protein [Salmonella enterica subsp. enterica serovar Abony]EDV4561432.1 fimbrial protein [Salmonella enterica subsp. enterica]HCM1921516.1 fimbrial protein [Salmonella enterica subsp. salamae serovar 16:m,t:e,n,x]HCM1961290.1 fimbrial protein [Salmonella enterica subsp. salamae serov
MKKTLLSLPIAAAVAMAAIPESALAGDATLDATLTATIVDTTCDMKLSGGIGGDATEQTINIIVPGRVNTYVPVTDAQAGKAASTFKIKIVECPPSMTSLKTTIKGTVSDTSNTALANQIAETDGGAKGAALEIARSTTTTAPFVINSTVDDERLVWTEDEIKKAKEVSLTATLRETKAGEMTIGHFKTVVTFEFSYE